MTNTTFKEALEEIIKKFIYGFACERCRSSGYILIKGSICDNCGGTGIINWQTEIAIEKIQQLVLDTVRGAIGEEIPHSDNAEFIDPIDGVSSKVRVKEWNRCKTEILSNLEKLIGGKE